MPDIKVFPIENDLKHVIISYEGRFYLWTYEQVREVVKSLENV